MSDNRDPVEKGIDAAGGAVIAALLGLLFGVLVGSIQRDQADKEARKRQLQLPPHLEFQEVEIPKQKTGGGGCLAAIVFGIITVFLIQKLQEWNMTPGYAHLGTPFAIGGVICGACTIGAVVYVLAITVKEQEPVPTVSLNIEDARSYLVVLPHGTAWDAEHVYRFIEHMLVTVGGRLTYQIVAKPGVILWRILDLRTQLNPSVIHDAIHAYYPEAEVQDGDLRFSSVDAPFYRSVLYFKQGDEFYKPIQGSLDLNTHDPLKTFAQQLSQIRDNERITYTLHVADIALFAYKQAEHMLTYKMPANPLRFFQSGGAFDVGYAAMAGEPRQSVYERHDENVFVRKLNSPLYHAFLMVQIDSPRQERIVELTNAYKALVWQFRNPDYNWLEMYTPPSTFMVADDQSNFVTSTLGRIAAWLANQSQGWRACSLILNPHEMAALWHLPNQDFNASGIRWTRGKRVSAPSEVRGQTGGVYLGNNQYGGQSEPVYLNYQDRRTHMAIFGRTGSGKTNLLHTIIAQDIANGKGVCVIDPLGNLVRDILRYSIPANREQDVVVLDITNEPYPPPFNIVTPPADTNFDNAAQVMSILEKLWPDMVDSRWYDALFNAILTLWQEKKPTIRDVDRVLSDPDYRIRLLRKTDNPALLDFWSDFDRKSPSDQDTRIDPIKHRLRHFYRNNYLYPITCHPKPLNFTNLMQERKIILVSLPVQGGRLTEEERELLGALVIAQIQMAAMSGAAERHGFYLFVDETQDFITTALPRMLSQARQFNLSLTLANQYLKQLVGDTLDAVRGNLNTFAFFQLGDDDAPVAARFTKPHFEAQDFIDMDRYQAVLRLSADGRTLPAFNIATHLVTPDGGDEARLKEGITTEQRIRTVSVKRYTPMSGEEILDWLANRYPLYRGPEPRDDDDDPYSDPV